MRVPITTHPTRELAGFVLLALATVVFGWTGWADEAPVVEAHPELAEMFVADQADRSVNGHDVDWSVVSKRDAERRDRVRAIVDGGGARLAEDYYHAAMVFQHGEGVEDVRWARDWAKKAMELAPDPESQIHRRAKWLFAAATDRHLHRQGKPQIYGTQLHTEGGLWTLEPYDRETVSAEERAAHGVRTIPEQEAWRDRMNEELRARGLIEEGEEAAAVDAAAGDAAAGDDAAAIDETEEP